MTAADETAARKETPAQTAGPYLHIGVRPSACGMERRALGPELGDTITGAETPDAIALELLILDGAGEPVRDAWVEIWWAGPEGGGSGHWARRTADFDTGLVRFRTPRPRRVGGQAPHLLVWIAARGINLPLVTRIYFPDEENGDDTVLRLAGERAGTMVAERMEGGYRHAIRLQGEGETVFLAI